MAELPEFQRLQYEFAAHIREPDKRPRPTDVEDRRMEIYRGLFFRNIEGFISKCFPVLRKLYSEEDWLHMARDFFARHTSHSPLFSDIPKEFLEYLEEERDSQPEDPPFLLELAHYEWVEMALSIFDTEPDWKSVDTDGDLLEDNPVISPLAWLLTYRYPVHKIGPQFRPQHPGEQPTYLIVYRNADQQVKFMQVNSVTAKLISLLQDKRLSGREALQVVADELQHPNPDIVLEGGQHTLGQLYDAGIILGTRRRY